MRVILEEEVDGHAWHLMKRCPERDEADKYLEELRELYNGAYLQLPTLSEYNFDNEDFTGTRLRVLTETKCCPYYFFTVPSLEDRDLIGGMGPLASFRSFGRVLEVSCRKMASSKTESGYQLVLAIEILAQARTNDGALKKLQASYEDRA